VPRLEKHRIGGREESRRLALVERGPWNQFKSWADSQSDLAPAMAREAGVAVELHRLPAYRTSFCAQGKFGQRGR
jgi:hypothetical protein